MRLKFLPERESETSLSADKHQGVFREAEADASVRGVDREFRRVRGYGERNPLSVFYGNQFHEEVILLLDNAAASRAEIDARGSPFAERRAGSVSQRAQTEAEIGTGSVKGSGG